MKTYVLYHADCSDGLGAAWAAYKKFGEEATYLPVQYGQPLPELEPKSKVYIIDFSYPRNVLVEMVESGHDVMVLDHHKTAQKDLEGLPFAIFDMNRSGAGMAWDYFHECVPRPRLINLIEDRDLWRKQYRESDTLSRATHRVTDFRDFGQDDGSAKLEDLLAFGQIVESMEKPIVDKALGRALLTTWLGHKVAVINQQGLISEIGERLYNNLDIDFAVMYTITNTEGVLCSLRGKRVDVGVFAKQFGGGGHPGSAGLRLSIEQGLATIAEWYANAAK